ncbi:MAG: FecR domain-containing protein [Myxococcales bacterium]|nr:FecR domain-containing protein [Myxococcales bacterium]
MNRIIGRTAVGLAVLLCAGQVFANPAPCGGLTVRAGRVTLGAAIAPSQTLSAADMACAKAIGKALKGQGRLRSVTLALRLGEKMRSDGSGKKIAKAWAAAIAAAGVPASRISTLLPGGGGNRLDISFRASGGRRPVALLRSASGAVFGGKAAHPTTPLSQGAKLAIGDHVRTAPGSVARLALADGSLLTLAPASVMQIGKVELTDELKRVVAVKLLSGRIQARATRKGRGSSFDIRTRSAVAGVRGTVFRVIVGGKGRTTAATLEGAVELAGKKGKVLVGAGKLASVSAKGKTGKLRDMLAAPIVQGPKTGVLVAGGKLKWAAVKGAKGYRLETAKDSEFVRDVVHQRASATSVRPGGKFSGPRFWRVSALDADGVAGMPSKVYRVTVK